MYIGYTEQIYAPENSTYLFSYLKKLEEITFENFNTSKVTDMQYMFYECNVLEILDLSSFNTSAVTNLAYMFSGCNMLNELYISNFDTSNANVNGIFDVCTSLTTIYLNNDATRTKLSSYKPSGVEEFSSYSS